MLIHQIILILEQAYYKPMIKLPHDIKLLKGFLLNCAGEFLWE